MNKSLQAFSSKFEWFLIFFIILQPIIDLMTSFSILFFHIDLTFGVIIRFGVMFLILLYILWIPLDKTKKKIFYYLFLFGFVLIIGLINNILVKNPIHLFSEIRNIAKIAYVPIILFGYLIVIKKLKELKNIQKTIQRNIFISMNIVSLVMIISTITSTGIKSYESEKLGHQGWFFAGNEIGAIMAICFAVVVYYAVQNTKSWKTIYYWIPVCMLIFSQLAVGTKVGYGSVLIILVIAFFIYLIERIRFRHDSVLAKKFSVNLVVNSVVLVLFLLLTPYTPVAHNMNIHLSWVGLDQQQADFNNDNKTEESKNEIEKEREKAVENVLLSGREHFLAQHKKYFTEAPLSQKLFGMGYGGNYKKEGKTVEMDFFDIFFSIGIIGFALYIVPFLYLGYKIIAYFFKNVKENFNHEVVLFGSAVILGLGIAYTAGHVLTAPAVSIYLAVLIAYLYNVLSKIVSYE